MHGALNEENIEQYEEELKSNVRKQGRVILIVSMIYFSYLSYRFVMWGFERGSVDPLVMDSVFLMGMMVFVIGIFIFMSAISIAVIYALIRHKRIDKKIRALTNELIRSKYENKI